jgi:hypothetical protein
MFAMKALGNSTTFSPSLFSYSRLHFAGMKSTILALLFLLVGCGGMVQSANQSSTVPRSGTVFIGDSIFGRLVAEPSFTQSGYVDSGVFGQRTDEVLARFPDILSGANVCHGVITADGSPNPDFPFECSPLPVPPKTVVIMAGWNNFFQGNVNNSALSDLQHMVSMAQAQHVEVIICTLYAYDPGHPASWMLPPSAATITFYDMWRIPLNEGIRNMKGVTVVDLSTVFAGQSDYTADGVHPTFGAGNLEMLTAIQAKLK